jgi:hypothetical protein
MKMLAGFGLIVTVFFVGLWGFSLTSGERIETYLIGIVFGIIVAIVFTAGLILIEIDN